MSSPLPRLVSRYTEAYVASLEAAADPHLRPFIESVRGVAHGLAEPALAPHRGHPALRFFDQALVAARAEERLCSAVRGLAPYLSFGSSYALEGPAASFAQGMVWAEIAGRVGLVRDPSRRLGIFLLAPGLVYPLHGHEPEEIYFVLSGHLTVEHGYDGERVPVPPGSYYRTPSEQPHALYTGDAPVLIAYCWVGDFSLPVWFAGTDKSGKRRKVKVQALRL
jgi:mannose-6-phosphate isomerase-like protein (cupin superfamily)